jgi:hypothetical protein
MLKIRIPRIITIAPGSSPYCSRKIAHPVFGSTKVSEIIKSLKAK